MGGDVQRRGDPLDIDSGVPRDFYNNAAIGARGAQ